MRALLLTLTALLPLLLPARGAAADVRCGQGLISEGASKADVLRSCGEPTHKEFRKNTVLNSRPVTRGGNRIIVAVSPAIEEWTYDYGPQQLTQIVVFENDRLIDVHSGGYGK